MKNLIIILLILNGCSNTSNNEDAKSTNKLTVNDTIRLKVLPSIGDFLADSIRQTSNNRMQLINSSQFSPSTSIYYQGLVFDVSWDKDGKVVYISTIDSSFITEERVKLHMTLKEIKEIQEVKIHSLPGWGHYIKLESGWFAAFNVDTTFTGKKLTANDKVKWIYK